MKDLLMKGTPEGLKQSRRARRVATFARASAAFCLLLSAFCLPPSPARAQGGETVDRMVAVVNGGGLITYSDLLWQLALEPDAPLDRPRLEDLRRVLADLIDQRLVLMEAEKMPQAHATEEEISGARNDLAKHFPSFEEFQRRLERVGLTSEQLSEVIHDRLDAEKYITFRFRSFTVVTPQEVESFYTDVYVPRYRRVRPGSIVPELKTVYEDLQKRLVERKVRADIDSFLDEARSNAQITILDESLRNGS
jgi:hypothetical protein